MRTGLVMISLWNDYGMIILDLHSFDVMSVSCHITTPVIVNEVQITYAVKAPDGI